MQHEFRFGAVFLVALLGGCDAVAPTRGAVPAAQSTVATVDQQQLHYLVHELCHDRTRLLTGLPPNELSEHEIPRLRQLRQVGQDAYFRQCVDRHLQRLGIDD